MDLTTALWGCGGRIERECGAYANGAGVVGEERGDGEVVTGFERTVVLGGCDSL